MSGDHDSMTFDPEAVREFERAGWNRAAAAYETTFAPATRPFIEPMLDAAAVGAGMEVLDLCSGPGFAAEAAASRGARVTGLDFSTAMLTWARDRFPAIDFEYGDAEAPTFDDARFDAVVCGFGIHHVPRPALAIAGAYRVLRGGGRLAFSIWADRAENIAWQLLFDAIARYCEPAASAAPPPGGGFATEQALRAMREAGFSQATARPLRALWRHRDAASLLAAMRAGTARMAALIEAQPASAMPAILASLEQAAAPYRVTGTDGDGAEGDGLAIPIACVIVAGSKP
jgi:SAM-dependent methyltransferase